MSAALNKFTNPDDGRNPSASVGGLATDRCFSLRRSDMVWRDGGRMTRSSGRSHQFDRSISIHEAAHAITSRLLNLPVAGVTVEITADGHYGETWSAVNRDGDVDTLQLVDQLSTLMPASSEDRSDLALELQRAGDLVITLLAGIEAEKLFTVAPLPGSGHDLEEAAAVAALIVRSPRAINSYLDFARAEAVAILTDHRNIVLKLADELIKHRTIYAGQIDDVIAGASHG